MHNLYSDLHCQVHRFVLLPLLLPYSLSLFASHSQYVSVSFCKYKYYLVTCGSDPSAVPGEFGKRAAGPSGLRIVGVVEKDLISC